MNIPIVYEDEWLMVLNKPAGLLVIPTPKKESRTLTSILNDDAAKNNKPYRLHPCHRLDRGTSGLIIYAKGQAGEKRMTELFKNRKVKKTYLALVAGCPARNPGRITNPIEGKSAITNYRVIEKRNGFSILEVEPLTGRTNQIRIHLKQLGYPVLGEDKFALRRDFKIKAKKLCLHAQRLEFKHPLSAKLLSLCAEPPQELKEFLKTHN